MCLSGRSRGIRKTGGEFSFAMTLPAVLVSWTRMKDTRLLAADADDKPTGSLRWTKDQ